jgi:hypothetical protein
MNRIDWKAFRRPGLVVAALQVIVLVAVFVLRDTTPITDWLLMVVVYVPAGFATLPFLRTIHDTNWWTILFAAVVNWAFYTLAIGFIKLYRASRKQAQL